MALQTTPICTVSEGVQCELGCESFRNCLPYVKEECASSPEEASNVVSSPCLDDMISSHANGELNANVSNSILNERKPQHVQYVCGHCGETFLVDEELESHGYKCHPGETPFKCHHCGQLYQTWLGHKGFKAHLKTSCGLFADNSFQCYGIRSDCTQNDTPLSQINAIDFCELVCGDCGLQFSVPSLYEKHCRLHNINEPFKCIECVMRFRRLLHLEEHKASHLLVNPYQCSDCGKEFSFKWALLAHSKEHGNYNYVVCCVCGALFLNHEYMASHQLLEHGDLVETAHLSIARKGCEIHSGQFIPCLLCQEKNDDKYDKNFPNLSLACEECGIQFICEEDLQGHLQCHETQHPFKCEECDKSCGSYLGLRKHVSSNHSDVEVSWCEGCSGTGYIHVSLRDECEGSDDGLHNVEVIQEMIEMDEDDTLSCSYTPLSSKRTKPLPSEVLSKSHKKKSSKELDKSKQVTHNTTRQSKSKTTDKDKLPKKTVYKKRVDLKSERSSKVKKESSAKSRRQGKKKGS